MGNPKSEEQLQYIRNLKHLKGILRENRKSFKKTKSKETQTNLRYMDIIKSAMPDGKDHAVQLEAFVQFLQLDERTVRSYFNKLLDQDFLVLNNFKTGYFSPQFTDEAIHYLCVMHAHICAHERTLYKLLKLIAMLPMRNQ